MSNSNINVDVVVVGQNYSTSLGLIQSAGEAGFSVGVVRSIDNDSTKITPELKSKYVSLFFIHNRRKEKELVDILIDNFASLTRKTVLLPADDNNAALLDKYADYLTPYFFMPCIKNNYGYISHYMDKSYQSSLAISLGINKVRSWTIEANNLKYSELPSNITFPCITKPQLSMGSSKRYIIVNNSMEDLQNTLHSIANEKQCSLLIEEYVNVVNEYTIPGVSYNNEVIIPAFIKKNKIGSGYHRGVTISGVIVDSAKYINICNKLKELIRNIGFEGIFDIELFESNNQFYFNEINLRNGAAGYALTKAGINLPAMYINHCFGKKVQINNKNLKEGLTFASDKAAIENYVSGYMNLSEYIRLMNNIDFRLLLDSGDKSVKLAFRIIEIKAFLIKIIPFINKLRSFFRL